ncbi:MAG: radical SAM protein [Theionarchaea archaeon]|nr:radical SAM protein [Theionarchaea archaeon]
MKISEVFCKSILVPSRIYGVDYALNPYTGCQHNCAYCYAVFMKKFSNHTQPWGEFVDVKINAPTVLKKQLKQKNQGRVLVSSVTDAYQPVEKQYELTRRCLEQFQNSPWMVSILTKSSLVLRDIDVLKRLNCEVGFTFTTFDESIKPVFEPGSSSIEDRLTALKTIHDAHIPTYAFFGPLIPTLSDTQESLETMFDAVRTYTRYVIVDRMNFYDQPWKRVRSVLHTWNPELIPAFDGIRKDPTYETVLRSRIKKAATVPVEFCF